MKNLKKIIFVLVCALICLGITISAFAATTTDLENNIYAVGTTDGDLTSNKISSSYSRYGNVDKFYIQQNSDSTISKIVASDSGVTIDNFSADYKYISSTVVAAELPIFGGYYRSDDYNFIVFGQNNPDESDEVEVIRVVKYSHSWERLGSLSVYGANTYIPFDAGSCRMSDDGETLFIHTCHEMYLYSDGYHHQANLRLYVKISDMTQTYLASEISNIGTGYCSHSFDQYIRYDNSYVYTVDHGDAHPRSVVIIKKDTTGKMIKYKHLLEIAGESGDNTTGVSLGDFEITDNKCIVAGISSDQTVSDANTSKRNVFVAITDKNFDTVNLIWLTDLDLTNAVQIPKIIKLENNMFYILWNEGSSSSYTAKIAKLDENGTILAQYSLPASFSKCEPILIDNELVWFNSDGNKTNFYHIDPAEYKPLENQNLFFYTLDENENATITGVSEFFTGSDLIIPETVDGHSVVGIADGAFKSTKAGITSVVIPGTVKTIGQEAFYGNKNIEKVTLENGIESIGSYAFSNTKLTQITIPGSVKTIGNSAFYNNSELETVTIFDGVETIGDYAFGTCSKLTKITLPDSVSTLGKWCLQYTAITELHVPSNVTSFKYSVVSNCKNLAKYTTSADNTNYMAVDGVLYTKDMETLVDYPIAKTDTTFTVPDGVVTIEDSAFEGCAALTELSFPKSLKMPKNYAFSDCVNLKTVTFTSDVYYLGYYAFSGCTSLESISVDCLTLYSGTFLNCTSLKTATFSNYPSSIPYDLFRNCTSLETVVIPTKIKSIGSNAFANCTSLNKLMIPATVTSIDDTAFNGCTNLTLCCYSNSEGHTYAVEKNIPYILVDTLSVVSGAETVVDNESKFIYGIQPCATNFTDTLVPALELFAISTSSESAYTGMVVTVSDEKNATITKYTVIIFGDVNGDGWYDGQDAVIVSCLANGMLTQDDVSEAVYMAADCNHDGVIDALDAALLEQAGALLANVDQSKPTEEFLETSSAYVEYLEIIDQTPEVEDETEYVPETDTNIPEQDEEVSLIELIINFIKSIFEKLLAYIPVPIK